MILSPPPQWNYTINLGGSLQNSKDNMIFKARQHSLNDLEWLFHVKMRFRLALLESEHLNVKK